MRVESTTASYNNTAIKWMCPPCNFLTRKKPYLLCQIFYTIQHFLTIRIRHRCASLRRNTWSR